MAQKPESLINISIGDKDELGFNYFVFMSSKESLSDKPIVKFARTANAFRTKSFFSLAISDGAELHAGYPESESIERLARSWVQKNRKILLKYWDDSTKLGSTREFLARLQRIEPNDFSNVLNGDQENPNNDNINKERK